MVKSAAAIALTALTCFGQQTNSVIWHDARDFVLEGKGWSDTKDFYDRLPAHAEKIMRPAVWNLSRDSAGMCIRFASDTTTLSVKWTLRKEMLAMAHMPASGVSGVDLYVREKNEWHWLGSGRPDKFPTNERLLAKELKPLLREFLLYLPLYNGVTDVQIGVPSVARIENAMRRPAKIKPIVFYGTSILQGGCASRPGMAYPAILGRKLDLPTINFGFSGNAWSEPEIAQLLAELDPAVFVLDPLPNMTGKAVAERSEKFIQALRLAHPKTPIILVENIEYPDGKFIATRHDRYSDSNASLLEIYRRLKKDDGKKLFYIPAENLIGTDGEATVDGTHPTDLGFTRMAAVIEPVLRSALKAAH